jgi:magnesium transporter
MFKSRHRIPGTAPATLAPLKPGEGKPPEIRLIEFDSHAFRETTVRRVEDLPPRDADDGKIRWIELNGLGDIAALQALGERYGLHPLALEDTLNAGQRAKVDAYEDQLYIVVQMLYRDPDEGRLCGEQLSMFLLPKLLITVQEDPACDVFEPVRQRIRTGRGWIRKSGPDYLAYALLDATIDHGFPILESIGEALEEIEDELLERPSRAAVGRLHDYRRMLVHLRRAVWPERDLVNQLLSDESGLVKKQTKVFLRDACDHAVRIIDIVESYRELAASLIELYLSSVSQRTNDIMRMLTVISLVFMPLTFIAGVYGMNFKHMPELEPPWGYYACLGLMAFIASAQLWFFKRKGWL